MSSILKIKNKGNLNMTNKEKSLLFEYRYKKLCRIENEKVESYNNLLMHMDNYGLLSCHLYDVIYEQCFKSVMRDIFELLKLK